jgi:hypothetical protein
MIAFNAWTDSKVNSEYERLLTLAMSKGFASTKQRSFFYALREEWNRRQRINHN